MAASLGKLNRKRTALLLCDMQERFRPLIWRMETVLHTAQYLTSVAKIFDMPIVATQQYTKAFGETLPECFADPADLEKTPIFEKKVFSMVTGDAQSKLSEIETSFVSDGVPAYILVGIEAHVCIQQTCLDLLEAGKEVHVIVDGVSSQQPIDRQVALQRMQQAGAFLTTAQSAAFMLTRTAEDPLFKQVSKLTIEHMKKPNEFNEALK
jgi:nicotinamidase-related amidase